MILINPNLVVQRNDPFTTGIVYMPVSLAIIAAVVRAAGIPVTVIDAFAERPRQARRNGAFLLIGMDENEIISGIPEDAEMVFVYAINLASHISTMGIIRAVRKARPATPVIVLENAQAVTSYALHPVAEEFYEAGADAILTGNVHDRIVDLISVWRNKGRTAEFRIFPGLGTRGSYHRPHAAHADPDGIPLPAWDLFPLENYWDIRFAHGPKTADRYLPLLTSRGCPYSCAFCVAHEVNDGRWEALSPKRVVDEMAAFAELFNVKEFHIEDLNPTVSDRRIRGICHEIIRRGLSITWKIAAGTKVETILTEDTIELMAQAGCTYISISPETGSPDLLRKMNKPFDLDHALNLVKRMKEVGIYSQACFVIGFPGESDRDLRMTRRMIRRLTKAGIDEVALFIITPVPGSPLYKKLTGYQTLSELNFSPFWREDYSRLNSFRLRSYALFLFWKAVCHPRKILRQVFNFMRRRFETKMEMIPYRAIVFKLLDWKTGYSSTT